MMAPHQKQVSVDATNTIERVVKLIADEFIQTVKFYFSPIVALSKDFSLAALKKDIEESPTILGLSRISTKKDTQKPPTPS